MQVKNLSSNFPRKGFYDIIDNQRKSLDVKNNKIPYISMELIDEDKKIYELIEAHHNPIKILQMDDSLLYKLFGDDVVIVISIIAEDWDETKEELTFEIKKYEKAIEKYNELFKKYKSVKNFEGIIFEIKLYITLIIFLYISRVGSILIFKLVLAFPPEPDTSLYNSRVLVTLL